MQLYAVIVTVIYSSHKRFVGGQTMLQCKLSISMYINLECIFNVISIKPHACSPMKQVLHFIELLFIGILLLYCVEIVDKF